MNELKNCLHCGANISRDAIVCPQCGMPLDRMQPNKVLYRFLLFLGGCFAVLTLWIGYNLFF